MRKIVIGYAAAFAVAAAPALAAEWSGNPRHAAQLVTATFVKKGVASPQVTDTGRTFVAGGVTWRVYEVTWRGGGFRHIAVHRQKNGEYLAIEGLEKERKWSHGVPIGR
ncbi:MAG TPA: hypothetical protein VIF14_10315 [Alphaproteobacteria bacterium]|jgi:hypothetical protein